MAGAGDLMSLGLSKTQDQTVRLSKVIAGLGMDMNQLVLTMSNQTTMRFDQLGVSVDGFEEKVRVLIAAGMDANDAFNEAFLQQAEEQLEKVGNKADETIGTFQRFEAMIGNNKDSVMEWVGNGIEPALKSTVDFNDALDAGYGIVGKNIPILNMLNVVMMNKIKADYEASMGLSELTDAEKRARDAARKNADAQQETGIIYENSRSSVERYGLAIIQTNEGLKAAARDSEQMAAAADELAGATQALQNAQASFAEGAGQDFAGLIKSQEQPAYDVSEALGIVDEVLGTNEQSTYDMAVAQEELVRQFAAGEINAAEFKTALEEFESTWSVFDESVIKARDLMDELNAKIEWFAQTHTATVRINADQPVDWNDPETQNDLCFIAGTPITTPDGPRPIEEIRSGDPVTVLTDAGPVSAPVKWTVSSTRAGIVTIKTSDGQEFTCSDNHCWKLTDGSWREAWTLQPGVPLASDHGPVSVLSVHVVDGKFRVYNFVIDHPDHTYMVGGLVVHNGKAAGGPVKAGTPYIVGEAGPEPFVPAANGYVLSRSDAMAAVQSSTWGAGGAAVSQSNDVYLSIGQIVLPGVSNAQQLMG